MYFLYDRSVQVKKLHGEQIDNNSNFINNFHLIYKNNNNGIIMNNDTVLTMRAATDDEIELFKHSELREYDCE